ncbi:hypothetical protein [Nitrosomonas aestuarii]|nr:hypothetical protein [Nitrosomonas aestuarii]
MHESGSNCTFIADKYGKHIKLGDNVRVRIQNHPSMEPVYSTSRVVAVVEGCGIKFRGNKGFLMFDDKSHPEMEIVE